MAIRRVLVLIQARILAPQASLRQTNHLPRLAVAWDSEPVRRKTERSSALGRGGALGLFAALRRKVGVLSRKRYAPKQGGSPLREGLPPCFGAPPAS